MGGSRRRSGEVVDVSLVGDPVLKRLCIRRIQMECFRLTHKMGIDSAWPVKLEIRYFTQDDNRFHLDCPPALA